MTLWTLFGFGTYISDIFDIIHARHDRVRAIVKNYDATEEQLSEIRRRISYCGYEIPVIDMKDFSPVPGDHYMFGFHDGKSKDYASLESKHGIRFSNLIHPTVTLGSNIELGRGICIGAHTVIAPNVKIGNYCTINRACSIGHDTVIGEYVKINPAVAIAGYVRIGQETTVGIGAVIINRVHVGTHSMIGAGAVVVRDVPDHVVSVGVPAKTIKENP